MDNDVLITIVNEFVRISWHYLKSQVYIIEVTRTIMRPMLPIFNIDASVHQVNEITN